jgi:predicted RNase H-like HicB family nuclease
MLKDFTLEYWTDDGWLVGRLKEVPGVFSQGETMEELEENIRDAYRLMMEDQETPGDEYRDAGNQDRPLKRREFVQALVALGCILKRSGSRHDIYLNTANGRTAPVPCHQEIKDSLCMLIRKQLGLK